MADKTYADLTAATATTDGILLAQWDPAGPGPLKKIQASLVKAYMLADIGTAAAEDIGTSGATVPLLSTANAWDQPQVLTGVTDASNAAAGKVGEYLSVNVALASAVTLTTDTAADVATLNLTAGDWDLEANVVFDGTATTAVNILCWLSSTSATLPTRPNAGSFTNVGVPPANTLAGNAISTSRRINVSTTTPVYLTAQSSFSGGTGKAFGFIGARRAR